MSLWGNMSHDTKSCASKRVCSPESGDRAKGNCSATAVCRDQTVADQASSPFGDKIRLGQHLANLNGVEPHFQTPANVAILGRKPTSPRRFSVGRSIGAPDEGVRIRALRLGSCFGEGVQR